MQSSTASIAVTISAFYAGAVGLEQGAALIIGQNIGTATSSALAAIGASATAKRLALAYVLFKVIAAIIAIVAFPFTAALMARFAGTLDGTTLLAAYHTAYNVVGVAVLLPATRWFTRFVERLLPSKESPIERALDPAALVNPVVGVEAARRAVAEALKTIAVSIATSLAGGTSRPQPGVATAAAALEMVRDFLSELKGPPETEAERNRMTSTLHALDHASRLAEILADGGLPGPATGGPDDLRAAELCKQAMRWTQTIDESITGESGLSPRAEPIGWSVSAEVSSALAEIESAAKALDAMLPKHRAAILASVATGQLTATEAFERIDGARRLDRIAYHLWRSAAHLLGLGVQSQDAPRPG
jgi:phosphate:Na+ symporter